jgi:hypothetical protein
MKRLKKTLKCAGEVAVTGQMVVLTLALGRLAHVAAGLPFWSTTAVLFVLLSLAGGETLNNPVLKNVLREDVPTNKDNEFTEDILNNAPGREGNYLKVKKIL